MSIKLNHKVSFISNFSNNHIEIFIEQIEQYIQHYENLYKTCDIKDMLVENLQNFNINCTSENIKLFDIITQNEIKTIYDLRNNKTTKCKIIIVPIQCNEH